MIRKLKTLGLALVAIGAIGAVIASAASAGTLHLGANPSVITAHSEKSQVHIATIPGGGGSFNIPCETATFEGTAFQGGPQTQTLHIALVTPTFSSCKIGGTAATVQMNGCKYTATGTEQPANTFQIDIVGCTSGKQVQVKTALCTVDMPMQNNLSHIVAQNIGGVSKEITLEATVAGVTEVQTGAACPHGNNAHTNNASIQGSTIAEAFGDKEENHTVTQHGHQFIEHTHQDVTVELVTT
jgi:hypothetical protein